MTLDERARLAVEDIQLAVDRLERETRGPLERFDRYRDRRQRNRRLTAGALAAIVALGALLFALRALQPDRSVPATPVAPTGVLLVGDWNPKGQEATWSTVSADGSQRTDLGFRATCARWVPTGDRILITNDTASQRTGGPLRPAIVQPDGTGLVPLDGLTDPGLNLGCGDMSPDGSLLAVEGWVEHAPSRSGDLRGARLRRQRPHPADGGARQRAGLRSRRHAGRVLPHEGGHHARRRRRHLRREHERNGPAPCDAVGMGLPVRIVVARRAVDRLPEAVRAALPGASGRERPASGAARLTGRDGSARPRVVARRPVARLHGAERRRVDDLGVATRTGLQQIPTVAGGQTADTAASSSIPGTCTSAGWPRSSACRSTTSGTAGPPARSGLIGSAAR